MACAAREYGRIANRSAALDRLVGKLGRKGLKLRFCYEDGVIPARPFRFRQIRRMPAARRCIVALTGGPAMYHIGIDVSTKESAVCMLDGNSKIVGETKLPTDPEIIAHFIAAIGLAINGSTWDRVAPEPGCLLGCAGV